MFSTEFRRGRGSGALLALALAACGGAPAPSDGPPMDVPAGDAAGAESAPVDPFAHSRRPGQAHALILDAAAAAELAGGAARPGDCLMINDHVRVLIAGPERRAALSGTGGHVVEVGPARRAAGLDLLVPVVDADGVHAPRLRAPTIAHVGLGGGPALVRVTGVDPRDEKVEINVDYLLESDARHLRVVTTATNRGRAHYREFVFGHFVGWGVLAPYLPDAGSEIEARRTRGDWAGGASADAAIVFALGSGRLSGVHGRDWSVLAPAPVNLAPGTTHFSETQAFVAHEGGVAAALAALRLQRRTVVGTLAGAVQDPGGMGVEGALVEVYSRSGSPVTSARTDSLGAFGATLEPGSYQLAVTAPGRRAGSVATVTVAADETTEAALKVPAVSALRVRVTDPEGAALPVRLRLRGLDGTPTPHLGSPSAFPAAMNELHFPTGEGVAPVPPGRYAISVGGGPQRAARLIELRVPEGGEAFLPVRLAAAMDVSGWFSLDPYVLTRGDPASSVSGEDRLAACACAGLDAVVFLDDGYAERRPRQTPGVVHPPAVFSGLTSRLPGVGAFGAVDLPAGVVAPPLAATRASEHLAALRGVAAGGLLVALRPRAPVSGYFNHFRFDPSRGDLPRGGFSLDFELLDVAVPAPRAELDAALADYLALVAAGHRVMPFGGSGASSLAGEPCGFARMWVRGARPRGQGALAEALGRGDVVASFGPLIDLEIGGVRPGGRLPGEGPYDVRIRVRATSWARPTMLRLHSGAGAPVEVALPAGESDLDFERALTLPVGSGWAVAVVDGPGDLAEQVGRAGPPRAITSPIWLGPERKR